MIISNKTNFSSPNIFVLIALLMMSFGLQAQQTSGKSFMWGLDSDLGNEVYLVGTLPIDKTDFLGIPELYQQTFDQSELIVFDINPLDLKAEYQMLFADKGFYSADEMLDEHLDSKLYHKLEKRLEDLGSPLGHMPRMKPWLVIISLINLEIEEAGYSRIALKDFYYDQANLGKKEILLLDSVLSEQNLLSNLSEEAQIKYLQHRLRYSKRNVRQKSKIFKAWEKGNFKKFSSLISKQQRKSPSEIRKIQSEIQQSIQVDQIIKIKNSGKNTMIFVDAVHLVGENSLLMSLQEEGVKVTRL